MTRRNRPEYPEQENIPSQRVPRRIPYSPTVQADASQFAELQKPHPHAYGGAPPVYVVSTFDARPINAVDFQTQSGNHADDAGFQPFATPPEPVPPYSTASCFYEVQPGRIAIVRDFQALVVPAQGEAVVGTEPPAVGNPIFSPLGASNTRFVITFLVDGVAQEGVAGLISWAFPFGDVFGECYVLAQPGQTIEMRLTGTAVTGSLFNQALLSFHGNLLEQQGMQLQFEPGTTATLPVKEQKTQIVGGASSEDVAES